MGLLDQNTFKVRTEELENKIITVKPFVQSPLNDRDPFDFGRRDWTKGISVLGILIYLLLFFFKFEKYLVKTCFSIETYLKLWTLKYKI